MRAAWFAAASVLAAVLTGPLPALAAGGCQIVNVTPLSFGAYHSGTDFPVDSVGELDVSCSSPMATVQIQMGRGLSGRLNPRRATSLGATLGYNIFLDAARTSIWGDGTGESQAYTAMVTMGQPLHLPVYGRIFALQAVPTGVYTDTIQVVVIF